MKLLRASALLVALAWPGWTAAQGDRRPPEGGWEVLRAWPQEEGAEEGAAGPADDPDGLRALARYWQSGGARRAEPGPTTRWKVGDVIQLKAPADAPGPVAWDVPEELGGDGGYYIDEARRTIILPSSRPGTYKVSAWASDAAVVVTLPALPVVWMRQGAPRKVATFVVVIGDGPAPADKDKSDKSDKSDPTQLRRDLQAAYDRDVQSDAKNRGRLPGLADELRQMAGRVDGLTYFREATVFATDAGGKGLQATRIAVLKYLAGAVKRNPNDKLGAPDREAAKAALKAAADALGQVQ